MRPSEHVAPNGVDELIGERVHTAMWRARITQRQIAEALHVDQGSVSRRLRGRIGWKVSDLVIVAQLCGVDLAELMPTHDALGHVGVLTRADGAAESRCTQARAEDNRNLFPRQRTSTVLVLPGRQLRAVS